MLFSLKSNCCNSANPDTGVISVKLLQLRFKIFKFLPIFSILAIHLNPEKIDKNR
jgi:hypothetical protein